MDSFPDVARRAAQYHGLVERSWLLAIGVSPSQLQHWMEHGRLERLQRGVYRLAGAPATWEQRLLGAVLAAGPGAVASHRSAARLWSLASKEELDVTVPNRRRRRLRGTIHLFSSVDLDPADVCLRKRIPLTNPLRTLTDLGAVVGPGELEDVLDHALVSRLVSVAGVERTLDTVARRGRPGVGPLRAVLDSRALGAERPDSVLEPRMARLMRRYGLPPAVFQCAVHHHGRFIARVDFAYPELLLAIEIDGFATHGSPRALQSDLDRQNRLQAAGWRVLRFTWVDVVRRPEKVAAAILAVLTQLTTAGR